MGNRSRSGEDCRGGRRVERFVGRVRARVGRGDVRDGLLNFDLERICVGRNRLRKRRSDGGGGRGRTRLTVLDAQMSDASSSTSFAGSICKKTKSEIKKQEVPESLVSTDQTSSSYGICGRQSDEGGRRSSISSLLSRLPFVLAVRNTHRLQ